MNLKKTLMELGNRLVTEHGFMPAAHKGYGIPNNFSDPAARTTHLISELTEFINNHDEARQVLTELGVEWPITKQQQKKADDLRAQRIARESVDENGDRTPEAIQLVPVHIMVTIVHEMVLKEAEKQGSWPPVLMAISRALDKADNALENTESLVKEIREYLAEQKTHGKGTQKA